MLLTPRDIDVRHFHLFGGLGGGARGFNHGRAQVGHARARFRCIGGVDVDADAIADFTRLAQCPGTVLDMFSRDQYEAFHGKTPPADWREATPVDLHRAAGFERPHIVFGSAPCKGFSGLLSETRSQSPRYQALNQLAVRGLWLALEAWKHDPPEFFLWENVPRIATRGRSVLDLMIRLLELYHYVVAETTHDCGEIGGLGQTRKRFLLVARHREKVPPFLYEPPKRALRSVGDVLERFPLPGDTAAGPMHRMRELQWRTWVRLAFVEAGKDWRSLQSLRVVDGELADFGIVPAREWFHTALGVGKWDEPSNTITSESRPQNGQFAIADPRPSWSSEYKQLGVKRWTDTGDTVTGQSAPGGGAHSVADPRPALDDRFGGLGVNGWQDTAPTIIGVRAPGQGRYSIADPRLGGDGSVGRYNNVYRVVRYDEVSPAVTGGTAPSSGGLAVADPRPQTEWAGRGKYHVTPFDDHTGTVIAASATGNGACAVADPRPHLHHDGPYQSAGQQPKPAIEHRDVW